MKSRDVVAVLIRMVWLDSNRISLGGRSGRVESFVGGAPEPLLTSVSPDPEVVDKSTKDWPYRSSNNLIIAADHDNYHITDRSGIGMII